MKIALLFLLAGLAAKPALAEYCPEQAPLLGLFCNETFKHFQKRVLHGRTDNTPYGDLEAYDRMYPEDKDWHR